MFETGETSLWVMGSVGEEFQLVTSTIYIRSRVAQWKRAGPITQRSVDRNHALLSFWSFRNSTKAAREPWSTQNIYQNKKVFLIQHLKYIARTGTWTLDLRIKSPTLYRLSYPGLLSKLKRTVKMWYSNPWVYCKIYLPVWELLKIL